MSETSLASSGALSIDDSINAQVPVFGRRAERMMKASSIEWSDNSEDEYIVSVIFIIVIIIIVDNILYF